MQTQKPIFRFGNAPHKDASWVAASLRRSASCGESHIHLARLGVVALAPNAGRPKHGVTRMAKRRGPMILLSLWTGFGLDTAPTRREEAAPVAVLEDSPTEPINAWAALMGAGMAIQSERPARAKALAQSAEASGILDGSFLARLAIAWVELGDLERASKLRERIRTPGALVSLLDGELALGRGDPDAALFAMSGRADFASERLRGIAFSDLGRFREALAAFSRALVASPGNAECLAWREWTLFEAGVQRDARQETLGKMARQRLDTLPRLLLAKMQLARGDEESARANLESARTGNRMSYRAGVLLAERWMVRGEREKARAALEASLSLAPEYQPAKDALARLMHRS